MMEIKIAAILPRKPETSQPKYKDYMSFGSYAKMILLNACDWDQDQNNQFCLLVFVLEL